MGSSVTATKSDTSSAQLQHPPIPMRQAQEASAPKISLECKEKTFLVGRKNDFLNGDLSKEIAITYRRYDKSVEFYAGDSHFYFEIGRGNRLQPVTMSKSTRSFIDIMENPKSNGSNEKEYIREYTLRLIAHIAKKDNFILPETLSEQANNTKGIYAKILSINEQFLVSDGSRQRCVTYTRFANKSTVKFSNIAQVVSESSVYTIEPSIYLSVLAEPVDNGSALLFRSVPIYSGIMKHNGDPGLSNEGYAAMTCIFSVAKFVMDRNGMKLKCMPEYLDDTAKERIAALFRTEKEKMRLQIREMLTKGMNIGEIAAELKKAPQTVYKINKEGYAEWLAAMREKRILEVWAMREKGMTIPEIQQQTGLSQATVSKCFAAQKARIDFPEKQAKLLKDYLAEIQTMRYNNIPLRKIAQDKQKSVSTIIRHTKEKGVDKKAVMAKEAKELLELREKGMSIAQINLKTGMPLRTIFRRIAAHKKLENLQGLQSATAPSAQTLDLLRSENTVS